MTRLAQLFARQEGFGIPGAIPTIRHNPGDLRHSPHSSHPDPSRPDDIGTVDTDEHGWEDLERQLLLYAQKGLTLRQAVQIYAPSSENDTGAYLDGILRGLADTSLSELLKVLGGTR